MSSSPMFWPKRCQLFQPIGGVGARPAASGSGRSSSTSGGGTGGTIACILVWSPPQPPRVPRLVASNGQTAQRFLDKDIRPSPCATATADGRLRDDGRHLPRPTLYELEGRVRGVDAIPTLLFV